MIQMSLHFVPLYKFGIPARPSVASDRVAAVKVTMIFCERKLIDGHWNVRKNSFSSFSSLEKLLGQSKDINTLCKMTC